MNIQEFQRRVWHGWDLYLKFTESFAVRFFVVSVLAALAFLASYLLQGTNASQVTVVTIVAALLMALCGGAGLALLYTSS